MPTADQDEKTIELLNLVNEYQELTAVYRQHFINGFLNLSRANFQSEKTKFGKDTFDMRCYDACKVIALEGEVMSVIDRREDTPKSDADEKSNACDPDTQLKNRKKQSRGSTNVEKSNIYKDPILQFGALTPPQLKTSQEDFDRAVRMCVSIINTRRRIDTLISEIENI